MGETQERYNQVLENINRVCFLAGRDSADVTLVAVSKGKPADSIRELYDAGHRDFGESRLQEFLQKVEELPGDIRWHFIGRIQSNKFERILDHFKVIHSISDQDQVARIARRTENYEAFIQVNAAQEAQKSGISTEALDALYQNVLTCKNIRARGLMTIGPVVEDPEKARQLFRYVRELSIKLQGCNQLSFGMSNDYEVALQEGATHLRIGSALFSR